MFCSGVISSSLLEKGRSSLWVGHAKHFCKSALVLLSCYSSYLLPGQVCLCVVSSGWDSRLLFRTFCPLMLLVQKD